MTIGDSGDRDPRFQRARPKRSDSAVGAAILDLRFESSGASIARSFFRLQSIS